MGMMKECMIHKTTEITVRGTTVVILSVVVLRAGEGKALTPAVSTPLGLDNTILGKFTETKPIKTARLPKSPALSWTHLVVILRSQGLM